MYHYEFVSFLSDGESVFGVLVEEPGAQTEAGIAVGDPLTTARTAYDLRCTTSLGSGEEDVFEACFGKVAEQRFVWFGGDPIENISFALVPLRSRGGYE